MDLLNTSGSGTTTTVRLANSSKKYLTTAETLGDKTQFGVKAGTYYIAIKSDAALYQIKPTFTTVTESKTGTTRSKAVALKKGGVKKGVITASQGNNTGDWYKFTIKKSQKVYLDVTSRLSKGQFRISVYKSGTSTVYGRGTFDKTLQSGSVMPYKNKYTKKLPAGTYYIKVEKRNGGNGYYKLKWS